MFRILSLLVVFLLPFALATGPRTGTDEYCLLQTLGFTNGFTLNEPFGITDFDYQCGDIDWNTFTYTQANPTTVHIGSSVLVYLNGVGINTKADGTQLGHTGRLSGNLVLVEGNNEIRVGVSCNGESDPPCYYEYIIHCYKPPRGGQVQGDPAFVGFKGQSYQVHGVSGEIYNLVSDSNIQMNARFEFLSRGSCPIINGQRASTCFSHPGSYLGEIGLKTKNDEKIQLIAGTAKNGFQSVTVNGKELGLNERITLSLEDSYISRNGTHTVTVKASSFLFEFENSDMFINQVARITDWRNVNAHGLLGQTWQERTYSNNHIKHIQGEVDDYLVQEKEIFGDSFVYNKFN